ncbi:hypothetical protein F0224_16510 [Vibrio coralliilyticus]|uniref:hypothetical protein n=1 Tax=Vibrio coralliilyticus TaxID=190893 RepID=UPI00117FA2B7|nr:hypothetical protein [Vibrio coralliilyticus]NOI77290.1 hypothetical protein [Vibrio coralliilyticus]
MPREKAVWWSADSDHKFNRGILTDVSPARLALLTFSYFHARVRLLRGSGFDVRRLSPGQ